MRAVVAERGQITIPKAIRDRLGLRPRTLLEVREENGRLVAEKVREDDPVADVTGCLKLAKTTDQILADLRGDA